MIYNNDEYDNLNEKLYKSGNADTLTSDPNSIANQYASAGVDISHYGPSDLARAHEMYSDYANEARAREREAAEDRRLQREYEEEERRLAEEREREAERAEEEAEREAELAEERELRMIRGEYVGDYDEDTQDYLIIGYKYPEELYAYLRSKGAYAEDENPDEILHGKVKFDVWHGADVIRFDSYKNKFYFGYVCDVERVMDYDMRYFVWNEWNEYIDKIEAYRARAAEFEKLKNMQPVKYDEDPDVEGLARYAFNRLKVALDNLQKTGLVDYPKVEALNYRTARELAFYNNPKTVCERIGKVLREILK